MLAGNRNSICVKVKVLAELLGRKASTVRRLINELEAKGIIDRIRQTAFDDNNKNIPSLFLIHDSIWDNMEA